MTLDTFMQGVGVACCIFTTGLLLAMGWHAGIIVGAYLFGPHRTERTYNVTMDSSADAK